VESGSEIGKSTLPGPVVAPSTGQRATWHDTIRRLGALLGARSMVPVWLLAILILSAGFRFTGLDWGQGTHRHPDERFLTMVVERVGWPASVGEYLDEARSPLNPRNNNFGFWVYGDLAITIVKGATLALNALTDPEIPWDSYGRNYLVGRAVSGFFDLGTLFMLFLLARALYRDRRVALLAAFLYGITVLAIQHSHFWVVDNFSTFFVTLTLYWLVRIFTSERAGNPLLYILAGTFFGVALATKVSIFTLALLFGAVGAYKVTMAWRDTGTIPQPLLESLILRLGLSVLFALLAFRVAQPYAFSGGIELSERWLSNMQEVRGQVTGEADPPWGFQWANRAPILFPLRNMVQWGMGIPLGLAAWAGWGVALWQLARRQRWVHLIPVLWVAVLFLHQGTQWVKSLRYFLPIYPMLVMLAAWLLVWLWDRAKRDGARRGGLFAWTPGRAAALAGVVVGGTFLYALAFTSIYTRPHTHIQATHWIYENIPSGSVIATEHYDEGIPFYLPGANPGGISYRGLSNDSGQLNWYYEDTPQKLVDALGWLDEADYIVTVSNRLYGSTARLPARFPMTINYYNALFSGALGFERVADFTSGPQLFGIELDDQFAAEEAFSVYDHPRVQIFQKTPAYDRERAAALLSEGVEWDNINRMSARQWTEYGGQVRTLMLDPDLRATYQTSGTWSQIFDRGSLQNRAPLLVWVLLLQGIGLLALPFIMAISAGLPERGYTFAKPLGLLLVGWLVWLLASLRLVTFSVGGVLLSMLLVGLLAVVLLLFVARRCGVTAGALLRDTWRRDRRLILWSEGLFWAFFALVLAIRWANPDIWHPDLGGERPMDFAYLNAIIKSPYFPPMDPWFAGGYINYYYFGFVLVATLVQTSGVVPSVAYNLVIPTFFAMLAAGVWAVALALLVPLRVRGVGEARHGIRAPAMAAALLAAIMVAVLGNLGELKVLVDGLPRLSTLNFQSGIPGLEVAVKSLDGLVRGMILGGQTLPGRMEWPYWNPTRTIPNTINEFPWFTFLYADLHAHLMALPYTVLALALSLAVLRAPLGEGRVAGALRLGLLALVLGALWPINTWDFPTYALVAFAALGLREWWRDGTLTGRALLATLWRWGLVMLLSRLLFLPFHNAYGSAYNAIERWTGERTGLADFLVVHGLFLFLIIFALIVDFLHGRGHNGAVRLLRFRAHHLGRRRRASRLQGAFVRPGVTSLSLLYTALALWAGSLLLLLAGWAVPALTLFLLVFALLLLFRDRPDPTRQMVLCLIALGLALALAVELVVLRGDIGRMNTVFKFYLQIWVLWGLAAAIGVAWVREVYHRWLPEWRGVWRAGFVMLFGIALLYPLFATHAKINDRFDRSVGPTLDGAAFMERAILHEVDQTTGSPVQIPLVWDYQAIRWMQEEVPGSPIVAEINTQPRLYGWGNRFAMWTGNPAIAGWDHHQRQQRAAAQPQEIDRHLQHARCHARLPDPAALRRALHRRRRPRTCLHPPRGHRQIRAQPRLTLGPRLREPRCPRL
jgi:YYY domain-containing protein